MTTVVWPTIADRVAAVVQTAPSWTHGTRKSDRRQFWIVPGSKAGTAYYADATDCTCPAARLSAVKIPCKHSQAVALFLAGAPAPAPLSCDAARAARAAYRARLRADLMLDEVAS